jgi:hypothetical protein
MIWQQNQTDDRQSENHVDDYLGDKGLPPRGFDRLAEPVQFAVLRGTYSGATCPVDLSTWQKSALSSTPCSSEQLLGSFLKSGRTVL